MNAPLDLEARDHLERRLRLVVITDRALCRPRSVEDVVEAALAAGVRAIQLRCKEASARDLLQSARRLRELARSWGALLIVNDRVDVALAAGADGVHAGPDDLPVAELRRAAPPPFLVGCSTDDPEAARAAEAAGADYIGCGAVWATTSKDVQGEAIGVARLAEVVRAVRIPVVGIGGITMERVAEVARSGAAGVAVIGAVMSAGDPEQAARDLLTTFEAAKSALGGRRG